MKKDVFFLLLVILICAAGFFFTNRSSDEILVSKKASNVRASGPKTLARANKKFTQKSSNYSNTSQGVSVEGDIALEKIGGLASVSFSEDDGIETETTLTSIEDLEKGDIKSWGEVFEIWKSSLLLNKTYFTKINDVSSFADCGILIEFADGSKRRFNVESGLESDRKNLDVTLQFGSKSEQLTLKRLKKPESILVTSRMLEEFCESN